MGSLEDKVRKARRAATNSSVASAANKTINRNAKTAGVKLSRAEEIAAMKVIGPRMKLDRQRTASRAVGIQKMQEKKAATKRAAVAIGNTVSKVKVTVKPKTTSTPKVTPKPKPKQTKKPELFGAGDPNYIKKMKEQGRKEREARKAQQEGMN